MRLLIINPNTSTIVTGVVAAAAPRFASPGTEFVFATGRFGGSVVATRSENAIAAHATVDLVARHAAGCDGIVLAISFDTGLAAARELSGLPVLGFTEAAMLAASTMGSRVGLIVLASRTKPLYEELAGNYGCRRLCGIESLDDEAFYSGGDRGGPQLLESARRLVERDGAEVVVLAGAVLGGRSAEIESQIPVPVIDGLRCAVPMIEALVRIKTRRSRAGSFARPDGRESHGLSAELARYLAGPIAS
jgi:allantoin racemase